MARSQKGRAQVAWEVQEDAVTLEKFLRFTESAPTCEGQEPSQVGLTLSGSPSGLRLTGSPEEVRADIEETKERQFVTAQADIRYPAANRTFVFTLNLAHNQLNATFQPVDTDAVEEVFSTLREQFPRGTGPSHEELERRAQKVAELIEDAEALRRSRAQVGHLEEKAEQQVAEIEEDREKVAGLLKEVGEEKRTAADAKAATESAQSSAEETLGVVQRHASSVETVKGEVEASRVEVRALEGEIQKFHREIEENQRILTENKQRSEAIVTRHEELQAKVDEQLQRAASGSLFHAFEERRGQLTSWKWVWAVGVSVAVLAEVVAILWLTGEADVARGTDNPFVHPWFLLKIAVTLPILYFIWFAAQQYRKERDREERYAFKSVLSLSLTPYMGSLRTCRKERRIRRRSTSRSPQSARCLRIRLLRMSVTRLMWRKGFSRAFKGSLIPSGRQGETCAKTNPSGGPRPAPKALAKANEQFEKGTEDPTPLPSGSRDRHRQWSHPRTHKIFRPQLLICGPVNELEGDPHLVARLEHRALDQRVRDLREVTYEGVAGNGSQAHLDHVARIEWAQAEAVRGWEPGEGTEKGMSSHRL